MDNADHYYSWPMHCGGLAKKHLKINIEQTLVDGDVCITEYNQTNSLQNQQQLNFMYYCTLIK